MTDSRRQFLSQVAAASLTGLPRRDAKLAPPRMLWGDTSRLGRPFSKDPSVLRVGSRYLLYYSMPPGARANGWGIGIAASRDLIHWNRVGEVLPEGEVEGAGVCAPCAVHLDGEIHLFYQTYGRGRTDAICHATSRDGLTFQRDPSNPVFRPSGPWTCGRAIDADVIVWRNRLLMLAATRDPDMKIQMLVAADAPLGSGYGRATWRPLGDGPVLRPERTWERRCVEAPSLVARGDRLYLFYAGGYNNEPQQIGCAVGTDGCHWQRLGDTPFLPNGPPGSWNASESGHPGYHADGDDHGYLFFQGNADHGKTWRLSFVAVTWTKAGPVLKPD